MNDPAGSDRFPDVAAFYANIQDRVRYSIGKSWKDASPREVLLATSLVARRYVIDALFATEARHDAARARRVYLLSVEYMIGRSLGNNLLNLGLLDAAREALERLGADFDLIEEAEFDAGLGNGGLGRLAACYLDSLATLDFPGYGYGINYEHGLFRQRIEGGEQKEVPDSWRAVGSPWLIERRERAVLIPVFGRLGRRRGETGSGWVGSRSFVGIPHDMPIVGYGGKTVNVLRLYSAAALDEIDMDSFQSGDYIEAFRRKITYERISKLLYPSDSSDSGRELRLLQEYFFVACALRDIVARHLEAGEPLGTLADRTAVQLNDTHPALAVVELLRLLVDEYEVGFEAAWDLCTRIFAFTNHTLLAEALECWPVPLMARVLPRHLELIEIVNARFLDELSVRTGGDVDRVRRMSIIEEGEPKRVRMAQLAIVGSYAVNGVSALHSELLASRLVPDFSEMWPEKFHNVTNGITPRRWLCRANPLLASLISERIGSDWILDLDRLRELEPHIEDPEFRLRLREVKRANKDRLSALVRERTDVLLDPDSLFDVQVKRIHEYKRQLLAAMHAIHLYLSIVEDGYVPATPRTCLFAGKAAPGYAMAKLIIRLLNRVADVINGDPATDGLLRVVFVPDYNVTLAEKIIPAADLSEQISTAGHEASGTGNMKLALNGALTVGTLDGANIEIREAVGAENIYIFGLDAEEVDALRSDAGYDPRHVYEQDAAVRRVCDAIREDRFSRDEPGSLRPVCDALLEHGDHYLHLADFRSYVETQQQIESDYTDREAWSRRAALNIARMGYFSSDRAVREYAREIWKLDPVPSTG